MSDWLRYHAHARWTPAGLGRVKPHVSPRQRAADDVATKTYHYCRQSTTL